MNSEEFAGHILNSVKSNAKIAKWYDKHLCGKPLSETETRLADAVKNKELTMVEAIRIALLIGLTTFPDS